MKESKNTGTVKTTTDGLELVGSPPYVLPLDHNVLTEFFSTKVGDAVFYADVMANMNKAEKQKIKKFIMNAKDAKPELFERYCHAANQWRAVGADGLWDMSARTLIYRAEIPAGGWASELVIAANGYKYVKCIDGYYSFAEFERLHGYSVVARMKQTSQAVTDAVEDIINHIESDMVVRKVTFINYEGAVETQDMRGLAVDEAKDWPLPPGCTFLSDSPIDESPTPPTF